MGVARWLPQDAGANQPVFRELLETDKTVIENHDAVTQALDGRRLSAPTSPTPCISPPVAGRSCTPSIRTAPALRIRPLTGDAGASGRAPTLMIFQQLIGCFPLLFKEGWRAAPGWFDLGGYLIILLKIMSVGASVVAK